MKVLLVFALTLVIVSLVSTASFLQEQAENVGIINGHDASPGQFPYQVKLSIKEGKKYFQCSGSLISHNWVLTAAHCTNGSDSVEVFLGGIESSDFRANFSIKPKYIIIHEDWDRDDLNDISLIRIPYIKYSEYIKPVNLPKIQRYYKTYVGFKAIATGWGVTSIASNSSSEILQYGTVKIVNNKKCNDTFDNITSSQMCTFASKISLCFGDSGGPLVILPSKVQVGITSFNVVGCLSPNVFTRVTSFLKWIKRHTGLPL
ncbi:collagenase-like [Drosophila sulfurigaster albostrigata]|uniref:collagenase-like n=1 Tax=Drosophila sulfurigaster albostrigata TaxID=89887 RepID=UPI002D21A195|nr:collagenase-like [Drosophila sulfurigaster albostrigata]